MARPARGSTGRQLAFALLVAATVASGARVVQLACAPGNKPAARTAPPARLPQPRAGDAALSSKAADLPANTTKSAPVADFSAQLEAELGRLYLSCPASSVVDLGEVVECTTHGPPAQDSPSDEESAWSRRATVAGVPRLAYPVPVRPTTARSSSPVASSPTSTLPPVVSPVADQPPAGRVARLNRLPAAGIRTAQAEDWLVDPDAWYSEEDRQRLDGGRSLPAADEPSAESEPGAATSGDAPAMKEPSPEEPGAQEPAVDDSATESSVPEGPQFKRPVERGPAGPAREVPIEPGGDAQGVPPQESSPADSSSDSGAVFAPPASPPITPVPPQRSGLAASASANNDKDEDPHRELIARNRYPSARECAECHEKIYEEWASSSHAYATVSPMFQKFEQKISELTQGTIGYFCYRCHAPVATSVGESRAEPLWNLAEVSREGVTCIACHRVQHRYVKTNGERRIEEGPIFAPVFGGIGGDGVAEAIHHQDEYKVKTSPDDQGPGQDIHSQGIYFDQLGKSEFCVSCHQVAVHPGIKLEVVWEQYRASPACKKGIRCQDCHMGRIPGVPSGFEYGPAAIVSGKKVNEHRRHSNHMFYGPGYSIAHPGIFPFNLKADRWTMQEWLLFDWRAGWGTDDFEDAVDEGRVDVQFPEVWKEIDDRYDAREIIDENIEKLVAKREIRRQVMENGSHVDGPFFDSQLSRGEDLKFHYIVTNTNEGHNLPSGSLGAQPQLWANVVLIAPDGRRIWESGYTDSYGDVADIHSVDVRNHRVPFDWQLFNLQTKFLITGVKGTDREMFLPVNVDIDQLPFIRPGNIPISVTNHPPFIRMEGQSLAPLGSRKVPYRVPGELMTQPGAYRLSFRMRSRAEPIYFMRYVGATMEMQRAMNEWMIDVHPYSVEFVVR